MRCLSLEDNAFFVKNCNFPTISFARKDRHSTLLRALVHKFTQAQLYPYYAQFLKFRI